MATKTYILTIDETELTDELRKLLESKGAYLHEEPVQELHLPPDVEEELIENIDAAERGEAFEPWSEVREQGWAYLTKRRNND